MMDTKVGLLRGPLFPAVDFIFTNVGNSLAVLHRISIIVESAETDHSPYLIARRQTDLRPGHLRIFAENTGWGPSSGAKIRLDNPVLGSIYPPAELEGLVPDVPGGGTEPVLLLDASRVASRWREALSGEIDLLHRLSQAPLEDRFRTLVPWMLRGEPDVLDRLQLLVEDRSRRDRGWDTDEFTHEMEVRGLTEFMTGELFPNYHDRQSAAFFFEYTLCLRLQAGIIADQVADLLDLYDATVPGAAKCGNAGPDFRTQCLRLRTIRTVWSQVAGESYVKGDYQVLCLCPEGFFHEEAQGAFEPTDTTYCAIIDPDRGPHTRDYDVARSVAPGRADRFQMMIATPKSCCLGLRFRFHFDSKVIESANHDLQITNRRDQKHHLRFTDGGEVSNRALQLSDRPDDKDVDKMLRTPRRIT